MRISNPARTQGLSKNGRHAGGKNALLAEIWLPKPKHGFLAKLRRLRAILGRHRFCGTPPTFSDLACLPLYNNIVLSLSEPQ